METSIFCDYINWLKSLNERLDNMYLSGISRIDYQVLPNPQISIVCNQEETAFNVTEAVDTKVFPIPITVKVKARIYSQLAFPKS